ncbi:MAG: glutamine synthetase III [Oscillospiraceae bacterium]|nr:glutamine synthetase III [Oscillospiraceae bacterium]
MEHIPDIFGIDVFTEDQMKQRLSADVYNKWRSCIQSGTPLELSTANEIAEAMKNWAVEKGATHYTHWFQPMTGITAGKHEAFIEPTENGKVILSFSGKSLVSGEPDASSFPNGGLRATFEARGYTAWDPTAYAFVRDGSLYIPTCFFSYNGAALDKKTPLLRSIREVSREAVRILRLFGDDKTQKVIPCVGAEQEYFLLPKTMYAQREDLRLTGRTLFGAVPPKGQELDDHYYGSIRNRVSQFMQDLDDKLWRLGILSKTKHNEAAPCQHELAPIYTDVNSACDDNQLMMQIMKKVAAKHDLVCLLHEKPFYGVNGSGKHNNWSLATDTGRNLFSPGNTPSQNAQFLVFLAAFISGIDKYQELLRASVAGAGNDHRLGACEAPPAIISIFLGDELDAIVKSIIEGTDYTEAKKSVLRIGVDILPEIPRDTTDRNRTSPLAFTGNKFEFRMVGASQSIAEPNIILNTIMAEELWIFADELEQAADFDAALQNLVYKAFKNHHRILFNGNGYSDTWAKEAKIRGLSNLATTADALSAYLKKENIHLVTKRNIFTKEEFHARYEIYMDSYRKTISIEAKTAVDMALHQILPAALAYTKSLCETASVKAAFNAKASAEISLIQTLSETTDNLYTKCVALQDNLASIPEDLEESVRYCQNIIVSQMGSIRADADLLEKLTAKSYWPYPTYSDLLFY